MRDYLETLSDKLILSNMLCDLASIVLKNNYFENGQLEHHQKRGFDVGTKFAPLYSNSFMTGLENIIFQDSEFNTEICIKDLLHTQAGCKV